MKKFVMLNALAILVVSLNAKIDPIVITEQTLKVTKDEVFYYGFADGDQIIFDIEVVRGKHIKEVEIAEYGGSSIFFDFKTKKVVGKRFDVKGTKIYAFRIKGGGLSGKICRMKISRIPGSEASLDFDPTVKWQTRYDSSYVTKYRRDLVKVDTQAITVVERVERVHSTTNVNGNRNSFAVDLPSNQKSELKISKVISWAYWIGVGDEGQEAYQKDTKAFLKRAGSLLGSTANPIVGLALDAYTTFSNPPKGDNIQFWFAAIQNGQEFYLAKGNSVVASGKFTDNLQGSFRLHLLNDNIIDGINVNIKIVAIMVHWTYKKTPYKALVVKDSRFPVLNTDDTDN